jgi:integrase
MERMLWKLRRDGRHDLIGLLATNRIRLVDLYEAFNRGELALTQLKASVESPTLGTLVDRWLEELETEISPRTKRRFAPPEISPRTKRRFAPQTIRRYRASWTGLFSVLERGRESTMADLTSGALLNYRKSRKRYAGKKKTKGRAVSASTLNRDMIAVESFWRWAEKRGYALQKPEIPKEREPSHRIRWLSPDEITDFKEACPDEWWPFFATLIYAGPRLGEASGLRGSDILLHANRISIHEGERRLKSTSSSRDVPISPPLAEALAEHFVRFQTTPGDLVFPGQQNHDRCRDMWYAVCDAAGVVGARLHDCRHTFGVHAAMAGRPVNRIQKLMGHASPAMTLKYMDHAPSSYMDEDAAAIAESMGRDRETEAREKAAKERMKRA